MQSLKQSRIKARHIFVLALHDCFDSPGDAYAWLAQQMGIEPALCSFGLFDANQCQQAYEILSDELTRQKR